MSETENVKKWYVVRTVNGGEKKSKQYIEAEVANYRLQDFVSQVLIPVEKVYQVKNGKKVSTERNYFPGYVLIEAALTAEIKYIIRNVPGVIGFLGSKENPDPLRPSEVNRILGKVDELTAQGEELNVPYKLNEDVIVSDGPFNGFKGTIEEIYEDKKKVVVSVMIFGRKTPLELGFSQIIKEA
ncbi:MAG: transcription termination/antitermination protein NusG [Bacteroidales bacterium]|nr:transcription termination/antitermination protein NusG [Bacteroidales bacterium]